jgi:geranylgeranyl diphosphate synthase type II
MKEFDPEQKIKAVMDIFDRLKIRSTTEILASEYITKSLNLLEKVNAAKERKSELYQIAASLIGRNK